MKDEKLKLKNIRDLEYNHLLNKQNIFLILLGTAIISISVSSDFLPKNLTKINIIFTFFLFMLLVILYYGKRLKDKSDEIEKI